MDRKGYNSRRQRPGSAWYWRQTDCWYYTQPGTSKRVPLVDEDGKRIRGKEHKKAAQLALARVKLAGRWRPTAAPAKVGQWSVAKVCSEYLHDCHRRLAAGAVSKDYHDQATHYLNRLCEYCGALPVAELKKGHVTFWLESKPIWRSSATRRKVMSIVLAAFNYAEQRHDVSNPLKGLELPPLRPRLHSLSAEDEQAAYGAAGECFREFLYAAIHTGLRPFCELARLRAEDVEEAERGMMWRVYSSKTKKTRKIPVRPEVAELTRRLMATAPKGSGTPLFRNTRGNRWQKDAGVDQFLRLKRKLGWDRDPLRRRYSCYSCRHTFAHRMLSGYWNNGAACSIETLAELLGNTPKVAFDHYGREWGRHYQEPLWAAIGAAPTANGEAMSTPAAASGRTESHPDTSKRGMEKTSRKKTKTV
jgi:integrase